MKLPSISTSSVVTGISNQSVHSDGYRRRGRPDKRSSLQKTSLTKKSRNVKKLAASNSEQQSESLQDLTKLDKEHLGLSAQLSKSLTNLADKKDTLKDSDNRQRYEHFSYSKQISSRRNAKPISRDLKDVAGGGNLARENTFASSYVSQDKNKKSYTERREQPHKDNPSDKYKDLKKIYGVKANKKDKSKTEPEKEKGLEKVVPNKSVRILTPPSPSTHRSTQRSSDS